MSKIRKLLSNLFPDYDEFSLLMERRAFVKANVAALYWPTSPLLVYLLASGVTKREISDYLPNQEVQQLSDNCFLMAFGAMDAQGSKYFFYENWFANYSFERSSLYTVNDWPPFKRHVLDTSTWDKS